jgi:iron-sulfur cluster assembly accessory protein
MILEITDQAAGYITELAKTTKQAVRLHIESGGCQGFLKKWSFDDIGSDTSTLSLLDGRLLIDETSAQLISPARIDLVNGISGVHLTVTPMDATGSCGCGASFSI